MSANKTAGAQALLGSPADTWPLHCHGYLSFLVWALGFPCLERGKLRLNSQIGHVLTGAKAVCLGWLSTALRLFQKSIATLKDELT